jgi:hypothetical protein
VAIPDVRDRLANESSNEWLRINQELLLTFG